MFKIITFKLKRFCANIVYQIANYNTIKKANAGDTAAMVSIANDYMFLPYLNPFKGIEIMETAAMRENTIAIEQMIQLHETEIFFPKCETEIEEWKMLQNVITRPYDCTEVDHDLPTMKMA